MSNVGMCITLVLGLLTGCAQWASDSHDHAAEADGDLKAVRASGACDQRWQVQDPPVRPLNVVNSGANSTCSGRAQPGALKLKSFVIGAFPDLLDRRAVGGPVQIYNCRSVRGGRSRSVHGDGRAVDFMIPTIGGRADNESGDRLANWLVANAEYIGVQYIIWDRTKWHPQRHLSGSCYGGSHGHADHIHVELTWKAARGETAFFRDLEAGSIGVDSPDRFSTAEDGGWIGTACSSDQDCGRLSSGQLLTCIKHADDEAGTGICTTACSGYCPDRRGEPETFCIASSTLGQSGGLGICVSKATAPGRDCGGEEDQVVMIAERFIGSSGASWSRADVCIPASSEQPDPSDASADVPDGAVEADVNDMESFDAGVPEADQGMGPDAEVHEPDPIDHTPDEPLVMCGDAERPESDHNDSCAGYDENLWRCACSRRYGETVSQVCRSGRWVNYELNPRDCDRCAGDYTSGCEPR